MFKKVYLGNTPVKAIYQGDKQIQYNIINYIKHSDRSLDGAPSSEYISKLSNFTIDKSLYPQLQGKTVTYSIHAFCENATMLANISGKWSRFGGELAVDYEDGTREYNISAWVFSKSEETLIRNRDERIYGTNTFKNKPIKNIEVRIAVQGLKSGIIRVSKPMLNIGSSNNNYVINPSDNDLTADLDQSKNYILNSDYILKSVAKDTWWQEKHWFELKPEFLTAARNKVVSLSGIINTKNCVSLPKDGTNWFRIGGELMVEYQGEPVKYMSHFRIEPDIDTLRYPDSNNMRIYGSFKLEDKPITDAKALIYIQGLKSGEATVSSTYLSIEPIPMPIFVTTDKNELIHIDREHLKYVNKSILNNQIPTTSLKLSGPCLYMGRTDGYVIKVNRYALSPVAHARISTSKINDIMVHPNRAIFVGSNTSLVKVGIDTLSNIVQTNDGDSYIKSIFTNDKVYTLRGNAKIGVYNSDLGVITTIEDLANKESMAIDSTRVHTVGYTNYARFDINTYVRSYHKDINMQLKDVIVKDNYLYCLTNTQLYQMEIPTFTSNATLFFPNTEVTCMCLGNDGYIYAGTIDGFILKIDRTTMKIIGSDCFTNGSITNITTE